MGVSINMGPQNQFVLGKVNQPFIFNEALDKNTIQTNYDNDLNFCLNMFEVCLHTVPTDIKNLMDAAREQDYIAIATISNKLKSNFNLVGMKGMYAILERIEAHAKDYNVTVFQLCSVFGNNVGEKLLLLKKEVLRIAQFLSSK